MKPGNLTGSIFERSVQKQLHQKRKDIRGGLAASYGAVTLDTAQNEELVFTSEIVTMKEYESWGRCACTAANDLAAAGAEPAGILLSVLLPPEAEENALRKLIRDTDAACHDLHMDILDVRADVTENVNRIVVSVTGVGKSLKNNMLLTGHCRPGNALVVSKWIGLEATAILARKREEVLQTRFSRQFIREAAGFDRYNSVLPDARAAMTGGVLAMRNPGEGGIFRTLWEMADAAGCGLDVDLKAIPIRQETVEICELFDVNPYQILSGGALLMAAENGEQLVHVLDEAEIPARVIGFLTEGNDRILRNEDEIRYLERPQQDTLYKALGMNLSEV